MRNLEPTDDDVLDYVEIVDRERLGSRAQALKLNAKLGNSLGDQRP
jgi:hypothetical protein